MSISTTSFELPTSLASFTASLSKFQDSYSPTTRLVIGAFIFSSGRVPLRGSSSSSGSKSVAAVSKPDTKPETEAGAEPEKSEPRMLLLHRASSDAYGDLWDFPGGSVEASDASIVAAVKREVLEETGLHVSEIVACVGWHTWVDDDDGRMESRVDWAKFSFIVRVAEEEHAELPIKLAEEEHQAYRWATEEEMKASLEGKEGALEFIAKEEIEIAVEAFRRFRGADLNGVY